MAGQCANVVVIAYFLGWLQDRLLVLADGISWRFHSTFCLPCIAEAFVVQINSIPEFLIEKGPMLDHPNRHSIFTFTARKQSICLRR